MTENTATQRFIKLIGKPVLPEGKEDFLNTINGLIAEGADINVRLPGDKEGKVVEGERAVDYYLRREQMYNKQRREEALTEGADAFGEEVFARQALLAREIATSLTAHGAAGERAGMLTYFKAITDKTFLPHGDNEVYIGPEFATPQQLKLLDVHYTKARDGGYILPVAANADFFEAIGLDTQQLLNSPDAVRRRSPVKRSQTLRTL